MGRHPEQRDNYYEESSKVAALLRAVRKDARRTEVWKAHVEEAGRSLIELLNHATDAENIRGVQVASVQK